MVDFEKNLERISKLEKDLNNRVFVMRLSEGEYALLEALSKNENRSKADYLRQQLRIRASEVCNSQKFLDAWCDFYDASPEKRLEELERQFSEIRSALVTKPKVEFERLFQAMEINNLPKNKY